MKKILVILLFSSILFSCSKDNSELRKQFLGTWNNFPDNLNNEIQFYQDSVVIWDLCRKSVASWSLDQSKIRMKLLSPLLDSDEEEWALNYRFNTFKDSLFLRHENDSLEMLIIKSEDHWKHYLKGFDLTIELPKASILTSLRKIRNYKYPIIYAGWQNKKLIVKGKVKSKTLRTPSDFFYSIVNDYAEIRLDTIHPITLVIDKNIPTKSLDSIKDIIRELNFEKLYFFHVYKYEEKGNIYGKVSPDCIENNLDWYWYGLYDWNGLNDE